MHSVQAIHEDHRSRQPYSILRQNTQKYISILNTFLSQNENRVLVYFISHQIKTIHAFIVNFSMILAVFVYAGKSCANHVLQ